MNWKTILSGILACGIGLAASAQACDTCGCKDKKKDDAKVEKKDDASAAKSCVMDPKKECKAQETCPVMGGKTDKKTFVDVKGYRIYLCCPACIDKVKQDPDKYIKMLQDKGVTLEKTPAAEVK